MLTIEFMSLRLLTPFFVFLGAALLAGAGRDIVLDADL